VLLTDPDQRRFSNGLSFEDINTEKFVCVTERMVLRNFDRSGSEALAIAFLDLI
jgi:hypothetical protein